MIIAIMQIFGKNNTLAWVILPNYSIGYIEDKTHWGGIWGYYISYMIHIPIPTVFFFLMFSFTPMRDLDSSLFFLHPSVWYWFLHPANLFQFLLRLTQLVEGLGKQKDISVRAANIRSRLPSFTPSATPRAF